VGGSDRSEYEEVGSGCVEIGDGGVVEYCKKRIKKQRRIIGEIRKGGQIGWRNIRHDMDLMRGPVIGSKVTGPDVYI